MTTTIKIQLGEKSADVVVNPKYGLASFDISDALDFTVEQLLFLSILGLKCIGDDFLIPFEKSETIPDTTVMPFRFISQLKNHELYHVLIKDNRENDYKNLSDEERREIEARFDHYDENKDGTISMDEVRRYYENKMKERMTTYRTIADQRIESFPDLKETIERQYNERIQFAMKTCEKDIERFLTLDTDNNKKISREEFFFHEAKQITLKNQQL